MAVLHADEIRARVEADFDRIVDVLNKKIALQSISAKGITADHMKQSAQFVAEELNKVGVDAHVVQSHNPDGTPGAWEVIGSKSSISTLQPCCCTRITTCSRCPMPAYGTPTHSSAR